MHTYTHTHFRPASWQPFRLLLLLFILKPFFRFQPPSIPSVSYFSLTTHASNSSYNIPSLSSINLIQCLYLILFAAHNIFFSFFSSLGFMIIIIQYTRNALVARYFVWILKERLDEDEEGERGKKFSINVTFNWNICLIKINNWVNFQSTMLYKCCMYIPMRWPLPPPRAHLVHTWQKKLKN